MKNTLKHITIKSLSEDDRPREKLAALGRQNLSDAELIAIILGSGNKKETAVQLAQRILSENDNNINQLAKLSLADLKKYNGVGEAKAVNIAAAFELGRRRNEIETTQKVKITSSEIAYKILQKRLSDLPHEEFWILILNRANQVVKEEYLSKGGISGTVVDVRLICKAAIENNASGIVIAHNHPSGQLIASEQDKSITKKLKEALKTFEIALLDHLIIGDQKYYSFADDGIL
ncbi:MAG: DNA repair protein RadC [Bacteroidota bacterium]|nr:DNA repair protein RadC [Bacteroidota bacterium]MDP3145192.1 DNA repair protein RadC [Bacteroidota bacterium]MDP3557282.1 DNA repair protein RadC [Bacteroidota bacterium]